MYKLAKLRGKWFIEDCLLFNGNIVKMDVSEIDDIRNNKKESFDDFVKKYNKLINEIFKYLDCDECDDETSSSYLVRLFQLREDLLSFSDYLKRADLDMYLRNVRLLAEELKRSKRLFSKRAIGRRVR